MKKRAMGVALLLLLGVTVALAADVTGSWSGEIKTPDGSGFQLTFNFKQDGTKVTGTVNGPQGNATEITNGKVDGDKLSFEVAVNDMHIKHDGVISGDEIKLTTKSDNPNMPGGDMVLKRAK